MEFIKMWTFVAASDKSFNKKDIYLAFQNNYDQDTDIAKFNIQILVKLKKKP